MPCNGFQEEFYKHSAAHLMAQAINDLYPNTTFTLGPATTTGFFYDFVTDGKNLKIEDLQKITNRMNVIANENIQIKHYAVSKKEAEKIFANNPFKMEILSTQITDDDEVGIAEQGTFIDLCKGGHVPSTGYLKNFHLTGLSGSYWRGNKDGIVLQRISGVVFKSKKELEDYLNRQKELEMYDHRKLGTEMDLFSLHKEGPGFPFFHENGMIVVNELIKDMRKTIQEAGYKEVKTPAILSYQLWKQSGHDAYYKENIYTLFIEDNEYAVKPMNCPGHFLIWNMRPRSYRELPYRFFEFGHVHRRELSGTLHGLTRVRAFTIDDAHIICRESQIEQEVLSIIKLVEKTLAKAKLTDYSIIISTRPDDAPGDDELWNLATDGLKNALKKAGKEFEIDEGGGAFYGPKIEVWVKDVFERVWSCSTIQLDFVQPKNFDLMYINEYGEKERAVVIHHAIYGSIERFLAVMLEHHKGHLPLWLSPIQITILPITDNQNEYANKIKDSILKDIDLHIQIDQSSDTLSGKIAKTQKMRVPIMIVVGAKEQEKNTISVRFANGRQHNNITTENLIEKVKDELSI
jgi:threonyl-tRNA synthetase